MKKSEPKYKIGDKLIYKYGRLTAEVYSIEKGRTEYYYICKNWSDGTTSAGALESQLRPLTKLDKALR